MIWESVTELPLIEANKNILLVYGIHKPTDLLAMNTILSKDELTFASKLRVMEQRNTWISCHVTLRRMIGAYLRIHPIEIDLIKSNFGKLYLANSSVFFNLSHTNTSYLLGFNVEGRIGVDLEYLSGKEDLESLIDYAFSLEEAEYCSSINKPERFLEIWTLKEAYLKAIGVGLVDNLKSVNVYGNQNNDIDKNEFNQRTFICPKGETASIICRNEQAFTSIYLN